MITIYGIKNCTTMKHAFEWLAEAGLAYRFHDYKKTGADTALLQNWAGRVGWECLLNTRGTTWRGLSEAERAGVDAARALALMHAKPSLIKRPVLDTGAVLLVGFEPERYAQVLKV